MIPSVFLAVLIMGALIYGSFRLALRVRRGTSRFVKDIFVGILLAIFCYGATLLLPLTLALPLVLLMALFFAADMFNRRKKGSSIVS